MKEIWKEVPGYDGHYLASNLGRIKSLYSNSIMKPYLMPNGYLHIRLTITGTHKCKDDYVHRIIAKTFLENPNNYKEVNHINEDKTDNSVSNLEWCSRSYNNNYGTIRKKMSISKGLPVVQLDLDGNFIAFWSSATSYAKSHGCTPKGIFRCCQGMQEKSHKYKWMYLSDYQSRSQ